MNVPKFVKDAVLKVLRPEIDRIVREEAPEISIIEQVKNPVEQLKISMGISNGEQKPAAAGGEVSKASRQVIAHPVSLSLEDGVLPEVDFELLERIYEVCPWVRACVDVISKALIARGWSIVPNKEGADPAGKAKLMKFFNNPNPNDTLDELLTDVSRDMLVAGNAFWEIVKDPATGEPLEIWTMAPKDMRVKVDPHGTVFGYRQQSRFATNTVDTVDFTAEEVIQFRLGSRGSEVYGLSPLRSLIVTVTIDKFAQAFNSAFFKRGAKARGMFTMPKASREQVERNRQFLRKQGDDPSLANADLVLEGEVDHKQIAPTQKDMDFVKLREFNRQETSAVYGVPPAKLTIIESGNLGGGTGEAQDKTFWDETIVPLQKLIASKINKRIVRNGFNILDWEFRFNPRIGDDKERADILGGWVENGVLKPEEVREVILPTLEVQKGLELTNLKAKVAEMEQAEELEKKLKGRKETLVDATPTLIRLENSFLRSLQEVFRRIKNQVIADLPKLKRTPFQEKVKSAEFELPFPEVDVPYGFSHFRRTELPDIFKQSEELDEALEAVDPEEIRKPIEKFLLAAGVLGAGVAVRRGKLKGVKPELTQEKKEDLMGLALDLATFMSSEIESGARAALVESIRLGETFEQQRARVATSLDSFNPIRVGPGVSPAGDRTRKPHERKVSRNTRAEIIVRTETNRAFNEAAIDTYKNAGVVTLTFTLAADACPECLGVAEALPSEKFGKDFTVEDARGVIPVHHNCRCTWVVSTV